MPSRTEDQQADTARSTGGRGAFLAGVGISAVALSIVFPTAQAFAEPPSAIPASVEGDDAKWQPALDYDTDGCYSSPAIDSEGNVAEGLEPTGGLSENCRDESDLGNTNTYARSKSNNGWTAYLYDSYFEKDQAVNGITSGHRHDIEHSVIWVNDGAAKYVSTSAHGNYETKPADEVEWDGDHAKIVYHKDGATTHAFRHATTDDEPPENHDEAWQYPDVISWNRFPEGVRDALVGTDFGSADLGIKDENDDGSAKFTEELNKAKPDDIPFDPFA